ncbi:APC family permease [Nocardia cyriacigeorgica]|uniref:APC family permease n=1 Tax=Nocardia cyriacigeorgica TaxID=135487 RepID=UPI0018959EF6|nr:APC family permease [Nocardia cyriacigeorgica]MBF6088455.1 APC family permease [Nocardia cyriacigeorgica]MBF6095560.1 APC family permease [Nocardia cyriacigeorgica]MBF6396744.1 APC family permease [Nocardia cyriacigeorgica]MBF6402376.1 APC family permease [Nocardia cyriacigeorgica]
MPEAQGRHLIAEKSPVRGLDRRRLPFAPVLAQSVAAVAPAGTAGVTPALVLATAGGGGALVAFVSAAVLTVLVAGCIRPMAQRMASVGGLYTYVARGLGPKAAVPTGWSAIVGYGAVSIAGLIAVGAYLAHVAASVGLARGTPAVTVGAVAVVAALAVGLVLIRGIRMSAWTTLGVECVSIVIVAAVLLVLMTTQHTDAPASSAFTFGGDLQLLAVGVVVAVSAFVGFESSTTLSGEAQQPFRSIPRALSWTPALSAAIYLTAVPILAVALHQSPHSGSSTPLVELLVSDGSRALAAFLDLGIAASFFACTLASMNALVRVLFCMGREGVAPRTFGHVHPRFRTPSHAALAALTVVAVVPVVVLAVGATPEDGLRAFLTLSACGYLGSYFAVCVSAPVLLRRIGENSARLWALGALTAMLLLFLAGNAAISTVRDGNRVILVYGLIMAAAVVYTGYLAVFRPARLAGVGIYDETQRSDLARAATFR